MGLGFTNHTLKHHVLTELDGILYSFYLFQQPIFFEARQDIHDLSTMLKYLHVEGHATEILHCPIVLNSFVNAKSLLMDQE
jgi:hypothetical protein